jgi:large subunit ribosomal protein L19e
MKLENKKRFAGKVLGVGKGRIILNKTRLSEVKEAMTRQDIKDLFSSGAISIAEIKGRRKVEKRVTRRRAGSRRQPAINKKMLYATTTRKLRAYVGELRRSEKITKEQFLKLRNEIRASAFKDKAHFKERIKLIGVKI